MIESDDEELKAPLDVTQPKPKQTSLANFLSGKFATDPFAKCETIAEAKVAKDAKDSNGEESAFRGAKMKSHRNMFFDEEAEDEEDEFADRADELLDEAAIEAELKASKFIAEPEDGEEGERDHLDIHHTLMKEEDDRQLDEVLQRFAKDKSMTETLAFQSLEAKYHQNSESDASDDDALVGGGEVGVVWNGRRRVRNPVIVGSKRPRKDGALFKLIQEELSSDYDDDDDDHGSYSEPDPYHDDEEIMQSVHEDDVNVIDVQEEPGLEDSLMSIFDTPAPAVEAPKKQTRLSFFAGSMDSQRKAKLLADDEETPQNSSKAATGAFTKK